VILAHAIPARAILVIHVTCSASCVTSVIPVTLASPAPVMTVTPVRFVILARVTPASVATHVSSVTASAQSVIRAFYVTLVIYAQPVILACHARLVTRVIHVTPLIKP